MGRGIAMATQEAVCVADNLTGLSRNIVAPYRLPSDSVCLLPAVKKADAGWGWGARAPSDAVMSWTGQWGQYELETRLVKQDCFKRNN